MTRLKDIAEELGLSVMTVSRVVNHQGNVSASTRRKVLAAVEKLDYQPNIVAQGLVRNRSYTIGLIVPDIQNPYFPAVARGCQDQAELAGYHMFLCHSDETISKEKEQVRALLGRQVDGLLIVPADCDHHDQTVGLLKRSNMPYVLLDRYWRGVQSNCVMCDDSNGAFEAVSYLISLGHRRIAHLAGGGWLTTAEHRLAGYRKAFVNHQLTVDERLIVQAGVDVAAGFRAMQRLLARRQRPTAVFAYNDEVALGAMDAIKDRGLTVPDDISLVGYSGLPELARLAVPLTTVDQPKDLLGREAMRLLLAGIDNHHRDEQHVLLQPSLIIRQSCKPICHRPTTGNRLPGQPKPSSVHSMPTEAACKIKRFMA